MSEDKHKIVRKEDMVWEYGMYDQTEMTYLWEDEETGRVAFLVKLEPGARIPFHDHPRREIAFLVEGEVWLNDDLMKKGDFLTAIDQEAHDVYSEKGCTFFIYIDYNIQKHRFEKIEK
ncbi:ChrR Cupin-like domain-containing protein [Fictibacillus solisalsi]|uniref:ChrR Cupin-like domain-containing protein n=1 Tax=Fictibacillus solisalsi TaxID=459525 RepID=A0A1H0BPD6_9BACL|nr:cupin domain-containing protein [Fictibacillus solisalsi]SDN47494.1 ChrR Cupin-like domain-containing protein [Fictibacillus solisalsi]